jgi:uncharacterized integral membrane protein
MWVIRAVLFVVLLVVLGGFIVYNAEEKVSVNIIKTRYINVPLVLVAFWAFVSGTVAAILYFVAVYFKQVGEIRRFKRKADSLSNEIAALRNRPIEESTDKFLLSDKEENK